MPEEEARLSPLGFQSIRAALRENAGILVSERKRTLVEARVSVRLRALGIADFDSYVDYALGPGRDRELAELVDVLTTNLTRFLREPKHFEFLKLAVLPEWARAGRPVQIWSAGCATGEEPYSLAMTLLNALGDSARDWIRILATDISGRAIQHARRGSYSTQALASVGEGWTRRYFVECEGHYRVVDRVKNMVSFARANLVDAWPMSGPFDLILCRNVMIYFDRETTAQLATRFAGLLPCGAHLFLGHSESLGHRHPEYAYVQPAVYRRV